MPKQHEYCEGTSPDSVLMAALLIHEYYIRLMLVMLNKTCAFKSVSRAMRKQREGRTLLA